MKRRGTGLAAQTRGRTRSPRAAVAGPATLMPPAASTGGMSSGPGRAAVVSGSHMNRLESHEKPFLCLPAPKIQGTELDNQTKVALQSPLCRAARRACDLHTTSRVREQNAHTRPARGLLQLPGEGHAAHQSLSLLRVRVQMDSPASPPALSLRLKGPDSR